MDRKKIIIGSAITGAIAVGYLLFSKANRFAKNIKYRFSNPRIKILDTEIELDLYVKNDNNFDMEVEGFIGKLYYGREVIGDITSGSLSLLANESDTTKVTVDFSIMNVANTITQMIQSGQYLNQLKVKGKIRVQNPQTGIAVNVNYNERVL